MFEKVCEILADKFDADASTMTMDTKVKEDLNADSLAYISIAGLVRALDMPEGDLCLACVNGRYPTNIPGEVHRFQSTLQHDFS